MYFECKRDRRCEKDANANHARSQRIDEQNGNGIRTVRGLAEVTSPEDYILSGLGGGKSLPAA